MRYFLFLAVLILVSCCSPEIRWGEQTVILVSNQPPPYFYLDATGIIFASPGKGGRTGVTGTVFAISKDFLLTAGHVCEQYDNFKKKKMVGNTVVGTTGGHGNPEQMIVVNIIKYSLRPDLCLLRSNDHGMSTLKVSNQYKSVRSGNPVIVPGAPSGYFPVTRDGRVSSTAAPAHGGPSRKRLLIDVFAEEGSSGSPVIWNREVIGLLMSVPTKPKNSALAVTAPTILNFINDINLEDE